MPATFVDAGQGAVLIASGAAHPLAWDVEATAARRAGVESPDAFTPALAVGSGGGAITGTYAVFFRYVDRNGNYSRPSRFSDAVTAAAAAELVVSDLPPPSESAVVRRQILRNTDGQANVFYVEVDTGDLTTTSFPLTLDDDTLSAQESQVIRDEDGVTRYDRFYRPFDQMSAIAHYNGRTYGAGTEVQTEGSAAVTAGSSTVVITGSPGVVEYLALQDGAVSFAAPGSDRVYEARLVTDDGGGSATIVLGDGPWDGATDPYSRFTLTTDPALRNTVFFSGAGLPESWHPADAFATPEDGERVTALIPLNSFLFVMKRRRGYRWSSESDPLRDGFLYPAAGRGCVNQRTFAVVGGVAYVLDEQGVYAFDGRDATPLSGAVQDIFRGTNRHGYRVNWSCARFFHAAYSPAEATVRFFVTLRGGYLPRQALCYCTDLGRWWVEEYPFGVGASAAGRIGDASGRWADGAEALYLGAGWRTYTLGGSPTDHTRGWWYKDGNYVAEASPCRITPLREVAESRAVGAPLTVLTGRAAGQTRLVAAVTGGEIVLDRCLAIVPEAGDEIGIGVIPYRYLTHRLQLTESAANEEFSVRLHFDPQKWGGVGVRRYFDHSETPEELATDLQPNDNDGASGERGDAEVRIDLTRMSGYGIVRGDRHLERDSEGARSVRVELVGASGPTPHSFSRLEIRGVDG